MRRVPYQCEKHVIVCVNTRESGECCSTVGGEEIYQKIKSFVREKGLTGKVWVTRSRCLGFCNSVGTTVVIYPDKLWLTEVTDKDLPQIFGWLT